MSELSKREINYDLLRVFAGFAALTVKRSAEKADV